jgi:hypothetical protein
MFLKGLTTETQHTKKATTEKFDIGNKLRFKGTSEHTKVN